MLCPACHHLNAALDERCLNCQRTLIHRGASGLSDDSRHAARKYLGRFTSGLGGAIGFFAVWFGLTVVYTDHWLSNAQVAWLGVIGALVGGGLWTWHFSRRSPTR